MAHERTKPYKKIPSAETEEELSELLKEMERSFLSSVTSAGKIEGLDEMDNFTFLDILNKEEKEVLLNKKIEEMRKKNERLMKRHKEIQDDKKQAADFGAEGSEDVLLGSRRGAPQSPTDKGPPPQRSRGGGHSGKSGRSRGRGYGAKQRMDYHPYSPPKYNSHGAQAPGSNPQRTDSDVPPQRWQNDTTPRRVGSGRTEHSGSMNRRGGYGRRDGGVPRNTESSRGHGSRGQMSPKSPKSPTSPGGGVFGDDDNPMAGMTITVTNSAIAASRQKKSIVTEVAKPKCQNITVSVNMQGKKGEPRRIVKMTKEEKDRKEWEEKRRHNIQAMEEELKAYNEFDRNKGGKPTKSYSFLDDNRRSEIGESRRHPRNWGGTSFDDAKMQVSRHRSEKKDSGPHGDMTMSMTGRERKEYADWKAERERIDQERLQRHKRATGEWKREWDREKDKKDEDDKQVSRSSNRGDRIGSGRFDNRGPRGGGKGKQRPDAKPWPANKGENDGNGGNRKRQNDNKRKGPKLTLDVTPDRRGGGKKQGGYGNRKEWEQSNVPTSPEDIDSSALSPGIHASSPLSPISPGVLKTPTGHVHVNDWAAEMDSGSGSSQGKGDGVQGKDDGWSEDGVRGKDDEWTEDNQDQQDHENQQGEEGEYTTEGGQEECVVDAIHGDITEDIKGVDLGLEGSQDAALSETGDSFESYKSADSEIGGEERRLSGEKSENSQTEANGFSEKADTVADGQDKTEPSEKSEVVADAQEKCEPEGSEGKSETVASSTDTTTEKESSETSPTTQTASEELKENLESANSDMPQSPPNVETADQPVQGETTEATREEENETPSAEESSTKADETAPAEKKIDSTDESQATPSTEESATNVEETPPVKEEVDSKDEDQSKVQNESIEAPEKCEPTAATEENDKEE